MGHVEQHAAQQKPVAEHPQEAPHPQPQPQPSAFQRELQEQPRRVAAPAPVSRPVLEYPASVPAAPEQQQHQYRKPPESVQTGTTSPTYPAESGKSTTPARIPPTAPYGQGQIQGQPVERRPAQGQGQGYGNEGQYRQFEPRMPYGPPQGLQWGWQDPERWNRGYDTSFFQQDPNFENWQPTIQQEAQSVTGALDAGDTRGAAAELNTDLWAMRGDIYGQNELLHEVQTQQSGEGAQLYLGQWDPMRGSWDTIEVESPAPPPGYQPDPSFKLQTF